MDFLDPILHFDSYLETAVSEYGTAIYALLFLIIFVETGMVVMPFLPGDSLLFAAGALAGSGFLNIWILLPLLFAAAVLGDSVNYWLGHKIGPRVFAKQNARFFKPQYLAQTEAFYEKHGGKTIILARFVPIVRTFAPFVAGVGQMPYRTFLFYNVVGGFVWVVSLTLLGYFFGSIPVVKENFEYVVIGIVLVSIIPGVIEYFRHRGKKPRQKKWTGYRDVRRAVNKD